MASTVALEASGYFHSSITSTFKFPIQLTAIFTGFNGNSCTNPLCINFMQANAYFSQFAGVLSGFVFTAMILLLTISSNQLPKPITFRIALHSLFIAWFTLVDSCLLYATLAGDQTIIRASLLSICADTILSFAALQVVLGIVWLFEMHNVDRSIMACTRWMFQGVMLVIVINFIVVIGDILWVKTHQDWRSSWVQYFLYFLILYVIPLMILLARLTNFPKKMKEVEKKVISTVLSPITFNASMGFTFVITAIAIFFQDFNESEIAHVNTAYFQLFSSIFVVMLAILLTLYQMSFPIPSEDHSLQEDTKNFLAHRYSSNSNNGEIKDTAPLRQPESSQTLPALSSTKTVIPSLKTAFYRALPFAILISPILLKSLRRLSHSTVFTKTKRF